MVQSSGQDAKKLLSLLRSLELVERSALEECSKIQEIVDKRALVSSQIQKELDEVLNGMLKNKESKRAAFLTGSGQKMASIAEQVVLLSTRKDGLEEALKMAHNDQLSADERLELAKSDLLEIRIEKKKVERLIENRETFARNLDSANTEISTEEINYFRRKKGK